MLRFGCPGCGTRLVVDPSLAGTEGPCPSCGDTIIAPPIAAATSLVAKAAPAVAIQPRGASGKQFENSPPAPAADHRERRRGRGTQATAAASSPAPSNGSSGSRGPVVAAGSPASQQATPKSAVSEPETQSKDVKTLLIMLLISILVVCIALGVYYYMTMQG